MFSIYLVAVDNVIWFLLQIWTKHYNFLKMTIDVRPYHTRHLSKPNFNKILNLWPEYTNDFLDILAHSTHLLLILSHSTHLLLILSHSILTHLLLILSLEHVIVWRIHEYMKLSLSYNLFYVAEICKWLYSSKLTLQITYERMKCLTKHEKMYAFTTFYHSFPCW